MRPQNQHLMLRAFKRHPPPVDEKRQRLETSFRVFADEAWPVLHGGRRYQPEWYIDAICEHLQALEEMRWLMIHVPPRTGKTILCSVIFQAWQWARDPLRKLLTSSYSDKRCETDALLMRRLVRSDWYQSHWPLKLADDQNQKGRYNNTDGGYRYTVLYGSQGTGDGGDILTTDDAQAGADMFSPAGMDDDEEWWDNTWMSRRNEKTGPDESCLLFVAQRLGWRDLANKVRMANPNRWHVLSLEARKTSILVTQYWRRSANGETWESIELPTSSTPLLDDGRCVDPREPGDLLTERLPDLEIDTTAPSVRDAQLFQRPRRETSGAAKIHRFDRAVHVPAGGFARRMGCVTLAEAIAKAIRQGWQVTIGWDHGQGAGRECAMILIWSDRLQECWVVGEYLNPRRTVPRQDALAVRRLLDARGISIRCVVRSLGDVGNLGKGTTTESENVARSINHELSTCHYDDGSPILGVQIGTPHKEGGSVDKGVELINMVLDSGGLYIDECCTELPTAIESWTGGEAYKDPCDALRYPARPIIEGWMMSRPGSSGMAGG